MADELGGLGGLGGLSDGLGGLSGDASMKARDAANMAGQDDMSMSFSDTPQSLGDVATQGMGEGLSAMREGLGADDGGMQFNAALEDEEEEAPIHAALEDEEEEAPIQAGRSDDEAVNAGFSQTDSFGTDYGSGTGRSSFDTGGANLASNPNQSIDDIFIAGSFNRSSGGGGGYSSSGGTMYDPSKEKTDVHVSVGMPPLLKKLIILVVVLVGAAAILKYGFHVNVESYIHPVDVQQYVEMDAASVASTLGVKFKGEQERYNSESYDYTYDVQNAGGLKLVDYDGKRIYIQVTGTRINYSIFGIRPQLTKFDEATNLLIAAGFSEIESYENTEELGSKGVEHCFYNTRTGAGVIVGKKDNYNSVKSVKYVVNYKKFSKQRNLLRG